jgi:hypothetical protein
MKQNMNTNNNILNYLNKKMKVGENNQYYSQKNFQRYPEAEMSQIKKNTLK